MCNGGKKQRVAVVGSGITGLSAAWLLQKGGYGVTLYESESYFGGHTLTDETIKGCPVDLGFQVFNRTTYGHFEQFLEMLGVDSEESDMNFSLSVNGGKLEWGSHNLSSIFAQKKNLVSPSFWRMIRDVVRFGKEAPKVLLSDSYKTVTLGGYLKLHSYSTAFVEQYLLPMCAAIWSVSNKQCLEFPIQVLIRFWVNHHLLDLLVRPKWRVVKNRSRSYVSKVIEQLEDARASTPVVSAVRKDGKVFVKDASGTVEEFDQIIFATHSDVTLKILGGDASSEEQEMLRGVPYAENDVYLHRDTALMPRDRKVWSAWNVLQFSDPKNPTAAADERPVCVSYFINALQRLPQDAGDIFVTLNPPMEPSPAKTIRKLKLSHPVFSFASLATQDKVRTLNGTNMTWFCGAWCGYGFHEDGIKAAVAVVEGMGVAIPWVPRPTSPYQTLSQRFHVAAVDGVLTRALQRGSVRLIMPDGSERVYGTKDDVGAVCKAASARGAGAAPCHSRVRVFDLGFFSRIVRDTDIGLGESYMRGEFEPDDLTNLINVLTQNVAGINALQGRMGALNWVGTRLQAMSHFARANTIEGSKRNISEHYDLGNDLYQLFLDESWMYSCGVFKSESDSLHQSQLNKLDLIIDKLELRPGDCVLEIGCGWGGFAVRAAERTGCSVTGVTISEEQYAFATERVARAGLDKRVTILLCDYRKMEHLAGQFDRLVSIEMIEAVGHENLGEYFAIIDRMLKPGGKAVIQAITYKDEYYDAYCRCSDFIRRHIFPGGHLPSMRAMLEATQRTGLACADVEDIGLHYATTLKLWHRNWVGQEAAIKALGHDDAFYRKWRFYFSYCEAGFEQQFIHCYQIAWIKPPVALARRADAGAGAAGGMRVETSAMLLAWCFLSGLATGKYFAALWMVPLFALAFFALSLAVRAAAPAAGAFRLLDVSGRAMGHSSAVSAVFSAAAIALWVVGWARGSFTAAAAPPDIIVQVLLSLWSGHCGWALFDAVTGPRAAAGAAELWCNTLGLACASVCLARQRMGPLLCLALASEAHSLVSRVEALAILAGARSRALRALHWAALAGPRVAGHLALAALVAARADAFPHPAFWALALGALAVVGAYDLRAAADLYLVGHPAERHAPRRQ